jgi:two-component system, OmpR family, response regulator RegX3
MENRAHRASRHLEARKLRAKLEANPSSPRHLVTVHGIGYRFEP